MSSAFRFNGFGLGLLLAAIAAGSAPSALAEIRATGKDGLRTEVNGLRGGVCNQGVCRIGGGTNAGRNKFHRFQDFDTRGAIKGVEFDTGGKRNLIVGVTSPTGSWINKALRLSSKANLFFLSPGGLHVGKGAEFINMPKISLSTADQLKFSGGVFDVFSSTPDSVKDFSTNPLPGVFGLRRSELEEPVELAAGELPGIHLDGINISLDEELLVDAPGGRVDVEGSQLIAGTDEIGGRIGLTGEVINVDGESELIASGRRGGGLIEVGGSWQNSDASVRQAVTTQIEQGAVLDASAIRNGDGGEIVVWSDISNPESVTSVAGTLWAKGGRKGGDGGRIETSGAELLLEDGLEAQAGSVDGEAGLWLQDPYDYTIDASAATQIATSLNSGTNVTVTTTANNSSQGATGEGSGDITVSAIIDKTSGATASLSLEAENDIFINNVIRSTGDNALGFTAKAAGKIVVGDNAQILTNGGDIVLWSNSGNVTSGAGEHFIRLNAGTTLNSVGGNIVLAGGTDSNSDGYPDGFAYVGSSVTPPGSVFGSSNPLQSGVSLGSLRNLTGTKVQILSNGGNITIRGQSGVSASEAEGFGSQRALKIDSGTGTIEIVGEQTSSSGGAGLRFGHFAYYPDVAITSASTSSPAIKIKGKSAHRTGIWLGQGNTNADQAGTVLIQSSATSGGGIEIEGSSSSTESAKRGIALWGDETDGYATYQFLSNQGDITFLSTINTVNSEIGIWSDTYLGQRKDSTAVQGVTPIAGSANAKSVFRADTGVYFSDSIAGGGFIEVYPYSSGKSLEIDGSSQGDFQVSGLNNLSGNFSGITIGDSSNTNGILATSNVAVDAPITFNSGSSGLSLSGGVSSSNDSVTVQTSTTSVASALQLGSGSLIKQGSGSFALTGTNTYTGATTINGGTLSVSGSLGDSSVVDVASSATYQLAVSDTIGGLQGAGVVDLAGNGLSVNIADVGVSTTFSGVISSSGSNSSLTKSGSGTLKLSGTNTYEGTTTVEAGVLEVSNISALGISSRGSTYNGTAIQQGGALHLAGGASAGDFVLNEQLTLGSYSSSSGSYSSSGDSYSSSGEAIIKLISGSATIVNPFELQGDSAIESLSGELLLDDTTASAGAAMISLGSSCGLSSTCGLRIGGSGSSSSSGSVKTFLDPSSSAGSDGINLGSEKLTVNNNGIFRLSGDSEIDGSVLIDSGHLQLAYYDAEESSNATLQNEANSSVVTLQNEANSSFLTMQNNAKISFLTDFPEESPSGDLPDIVTLGPGNQTFYVESGRAVVINNLTFTGSGNLVKDGGGSLTFYDMSNGGTGVLEHTGTTTVLAGQFITVNPAYAPSPSPSPSPSEDEDEEVVENPSVVVKPTLPVEVDVKPLEVGKGHNGPGGLDPSINPKGRRGDKKKGSVEDPSNSSKGTRGNNQGEFGGDIQNGSVGDIQKGSIGGDPNYPPEDFNPEPPRGDDPNSPPEDSKPEPPEKEIKPDSESESRGLGEGLPSGDKDKEEEVVDSILRSQAPQAPAAPSRVAPTQAPTRSAAPAPVAPAPDTASGSAPGSAPDAASNPGSEGGVSDAPKGGEIASSEGPRAESGSSGEGEPGVGPEGQGESADGDGPPEGGSPDGEGEGAGGEPSGGDGERKAEIEGADPAALVPPSLSGEGYEVSLSLESSFQMADSGNPSIGAAPSGAASVGGGPDGPGGGGGGLVSSSSQVGAAAAPSAVAEGGAAPISGSSEGSGPGGGAPAGGSGSEGSGPAGGAQAGGSGSEGEGGSAAPGAGAGAEEGASGDGGGRGEAGAEVAAGSEGDGAGEVGGGGGEESSGDAAAAGSETAGAGDEAGNGGEEGAATETADSGEEGGDESAAAETETADSGEEGGDESAAAETETADSGEEGAGDESADGEESAAGGVDDEGESASSEAGEGEDAAGEDAAGEDAGAEGDSAAGEEAPSENPKEQSAAVAVQRVNAKRASQNLARGDAKATSQTLQGLNLPDLSNKRTPTPGAIANSLRQIRQRIMSGAGPR